MCCGIREFGILVHVAVVDWDQKVLFFMELSYLEHARVWGCQQDVKDFPAEVYAE